VEPVLEDVMAIATTGEDLENTDVPITSATVEISDDKLERKPEEELFVLVDDDLDNDIVSSHAAAFHRVDPELEQTPAAATEQPLAAEGNAAEKMTEETDVNATYSTTNEDTAAEKTKVTEKASPKRLVFGAD